MKLKKLPPKLPRGALRMYPEGSPIPFIVDRVFIKKLRRIRWHFIPKKKRARGFFTATNTRQYLHRYVLNLAGKFYPEVTFANGDWNDCRLVNLKPYRREEEGAMRRMFRNNTSKRKGVTFHKRKKQWAAMIRVKGKLVHLGYFPDPDAAAAAYSRAWNIAHPTLANQPSGRF